MSFLHHIFAFDSGSPLLFTRLYFWVFLLVVYVVFALIMELPFWRDDFRAPSRYRLHARNVFLLLVSWFFYYKTSGLFLYILLTLTLVNWLVGLQIGRCNAGGRPPFLKPLLLVMAVLINLGFLFYYKYAYFGVDVFNSVFGTSYTIVDRIILPVGISFYTFQVISYTVDVYRGHVKPVADILDFGFYVAFFPQLVAGPIVRATEFIPQLYKPFRLSRRFFGVAVFWILNGLVKKLVLSDYLAVNFIDRVFDNPMLFTGFENLFALFAYSLQVYADFSGYTDIAIGVAMLMGFYLPKNFDSPYKSQNPQEFWRRWHQSLSRWLKSYVYIPLGGNRTLLFSRYKGELTKRRKLLCANINSFMTMLIGGLWHGASWNFVIWGGLNGVGMIVNKIWREMGWYIRILLMTVLLTLFVIWRSFSPLPVLNLFTVWTALLWVGTFVRFIYWWVRTLLHMGVERGWWAKCVNAMALVWAVTQTFAFITFTRLFFRSSSNLDPAGANEVAWRTARQIIAQIGGAWNSRVILPFLMEYRAVVVLFVFGMLVHWLPERWKRWYRINFALLPLPVMVLLVALVVFVVYQFITADMQPFIYFQF